MDNSEQDSEKKKRTEHDAVPPSYGHVEPLPPRNFSISLPSSISVGVIVTIVGGFWSMLIFSFTEYKRLSETIENLREQVVELRVTSATMKDQLDTCRKDLDQVEDHLFDHEENDARGPHKHNKK